MSALKHAHAAAGASASASSAATSTTASTKAASPEGASSAAGKAAPLTKDQIIKVIGTIASVMSVIMYVSYIPQIAANLAGNPGVFWQPLAALFNCVFWTVYGIGTKPRQWPIIIANVPGIFLAAITVVTCFVH